MMQKLTDFQAGQLLYIHFEGTFKFRTDTGTRVPKPQWSMMITALVSGGYITFNCGPVLTDKGHEYLDKHHLSIPVLS